MILSNKNVILIIVILIFYIIIYSNNTEKFTSKFVHLNDINNKIYKVNYNEIFPLKKYKFYNKYVWGPAKTDFLLTYYHNDKYDPMKYIKYRPTNTYLKLKDNKGLLKPADININNYKYKICTKDTKRCKWENSSHKSDKLPQCCASYLTQMLFYLHKLFKKHKIKYFIYYGTLLGSIRHGGIIPYDTDIDIYINIKDYPNLKKLKPFIEKKTHYELSISKDVTRLNFSKINTQHVDIFFYNQV